MTIRRAIKPLGRAIPINWEMPLMRSNNQDGIVVTGSNGAAYQAFDRNTGTSAYWGVLNGSKWFNIKLPFKVIITKIEVCQNSPGSHDDSRFNFMAFYTDSSQSKVISGVNINWNPYNWATTEVSSKIKTDNIYILVGGQGYFGVPEIRVYGYRII